MNSCYRTTCLLSLHKYQQGSSHMMRSELSSTFLVGRAVSDRPDRTFLLGSRHRLRLQRQKMFLLDSLSPGQTYNSDLLHREHILYHGHHLEQRKETKLQLLSINY